MLCETAGSSSITKMRIGLPSTRPAKLPVGNVKKGLRADLEQRCRGASVQGVLEGPGGFSDFSSARWPAM